MISGSQLPRVLECPASETLPHVAEDSAASQQGTEIHRYLQDVAELGAVRALERVPGPYREICASIPTSVVPPGVLPEAAFAYHPATDTARALPPVRHRDYAAAGVRDDEVPCTIDVVARHGLLGARSGYAGDYKTGQRDVARPQQNAQLALAALCVSRAWGFDKVVGQVIRCPPNAEPWTLTHTFDAFDLADWAHRIAAAQRHVKGLVDGTVDVGSGDFRRGPHCTYCPGKAACPAQTQLLQVLTTAEPARRHLRLQITSETAAEAYRRYRAAKALVTALGQELRAWASHSPIDLGDGLVYGPVPGRPREALHAATGAAVVREVLSEMYGDDAAGAAVELRPHSTKSKIRAALRAHKLPEQSLRDAEEAVYARLRAYGALVESQSSDIKEHRR